MDEAGKETGAIVHGCKRKIEMCAVAHRQEEETGAGRVAWTSAQKHEKEKKEKGNARCRA